MIVRDIMTTKLVMVEPDDMLAHAATLLRQNSFHHLPVARTVTGPRESEYGPRKTVILLEGLLTSQDIDMAAALTQQESSQESSNETLQRPWQDRRVSEVMHRALIRVTPTTGVAAAAQILVERGLDYLPVVEYGHDDYENRAILVGLVTRSDLLRVLARAMGAFEPGMQLDITLSAGDIAPLVETLRIASELHMQIHSVIAAPLTDDVPRTATVRLGTINPTPLLMRLQAEGIEYSFGSLPMDDTPLAESEKHA